MLQMDKGGEAAYMAHAVQSGKARLHIWYQEGQRAELPALCTQKRGEPWRVAWMASSPQAATHTPEDL